MVKNTCIRFMFIGCLLMVATLALPDTCSNNEVAGDREIWNATPYMTERWYRDMFADFYNLQEGDWDEGWGWAKYNDPDPDRYEFCKMMSAGYLLWSGLADSLSLQGAWSARSIAEGATTSSEPYPQPSVVARNSRNIDFLYRGSTGELVHVGFTDSPWHPGAFPASRTSTNVSDLLKNEKEGYLIESGPVVLNRSSNTLDVFARGQGHDLFHFKYVKWGWFPPQWSAQNLTMLTVRSQPIGNIYRYFIYTKPLAIRRTNSSLDVFAIDNFNHVIHYYWEQGLQWNAEDLTQICGDDFRISDGLVVHRRNNTTMDVFGANSNDHLIHFFWSDTSGWSAEDITESRNSNYRVDGTPSVVSLGPAKDILLVYMRSGYDLIIYAWVPAWGTWWEVNVLGTDYAVEGDLVAIARSVNTADVFIREINGHLIHAYYTEPGGFGYEDLTRELNGYRIDTTPVAFTADPGRLDVFGLSSFGSLMHFFWTAELGWDVENVHLSPNVSPTFHTVDGTPVVVQRQANTLDVFAGRRSYSSRTVHFTAAIGLTVNPWHTRGEYSNWAAGSLHDFDYVPKKADAWASASDDQVTMKCKSFNCIPAERASTMLHEATHVIFHPFPHPANNMDPWFFHAIRHPSGALTGNTRNHSMWQMEVEYLTDISEFPAGIPLDAYDGAIDIATNYMNNHIQNPPGWTPGVPRPLN